MRKIQIGVIGAYDGLPIEKYRKSARGLGKEIALAGAIFIGGVERRAGLVKEAAKAARAAGGFVVSIARKKTNARYCDIVIPTYGAKGLREYILPLACDVIISINGGSGTLNEISVAYQNKIPVVMLEKSGGWTGKLVGKYLDDRRKSKFYRAQNPKEAVKIALKLFKNFGGGNSAKSIRNKTR